MDCGFTFRGRALLSPTIQPVQMVNRRGGQLPPSRTETPSSTPTFSLLTPILYEGRITMQNHSQAKESIPSGLLSLAMAFVPTQGFDTPYDPVLAFSRGTIFPALDKPFLGEEAVPQ